MDDLTRATMAAAEVYFRSSGHNADTMALTLAVDAALAASGEAKYAHELQVALTGLAGGGSDNFVRHGNEFRADIPYCVDKIRQRLASPVDGVRALKACMRIVAYRQNNLDVPTADTFERIACEGLGIGDSKKQRPETQKARHPSRSAGPWMPADPPYNPCTKLDRVGA